MVELFEPQISEIIALVGKQVEAASHKDAKIDVGTLSRSNCVGILR